MKARFVASIVAILAILAIIATADRFDLLSGAARSIVVGILGWVGADVVPMGEHLEVDGVLIPWTSDCAGLNVMALLWVFTLWNFRDQSFTGAFFGRLLLALPVTLFANTARILTLVAYRTRFYPEVETMEAHFLVGFLWVLPFLGLFVCPGAREPFLSLIRGEALRLAGIFSLAVPLFWAPGGLYAVTCVMIALVLRTGGRPVSKEAGVARGFRRPLWLLAGVAVGLLGVESLWVGWLLLCPDDRPAGQGRRALLDWGLAAGTLPIVTVQSWAFLFLLPLFVASLFRLRSAGEALPASPVDSTPRRVRFRVPLRPCQDLLIGTAFLWPFIFPAFASDPGHDWKPPAVAFTRPLKSAGYEISLVGQPPDLALVWYGSQRNGRHHSVKVCQQFRGVRLQAIRDHEGLFTDGRHLVKECFLLPGRPPLSYSGYLRETILPGTKPGVHVIATTSIDSMSAETFCHSTEQLVLRLLSGGEREEHPMQIVSW